MISMLGLLNWFTSHMFSKLVSGMYRLRTKESRREYRLKNTAAFERYDYIAFRVDRLVYWMLSWVVPLIYVFTIIFNPSQLHLKQDAAFTIVIWLFIIIHIVFEITVKDRVKLEKPETLKLAYHLKKLRRR